ncbi:hypothetical protein E2562_007799 [Oryza meyeriana var. granulata]|uniref:RING-type E3 ubiquitin transferase n=1 Tax=Oryza meyeriana var. granulata TaxID=110450 RepID=A0A6G1F573_9ORYZ|nr:hypothetical protein E2562_007799 [Oryza meyeriana var. granulata]
MPGDSASATLQYTGIGAFVVIVGIVVLAVVFYSRSGRRTPGGPGAGPDAVTALQEQQRLQRGLGPDDVSVLPTFTYHAAAASASPGRCGLIGRGDAKEVAAADCCAVCLDELGEGALVRMLPSCKHYFHASCVDVWLLSRATCPVCRGSPGQEKVRLGLASLSPPLPQLRRCSPSPPKEAAADTSRAKNSFAASRSPSPMRSSSRFDLAATSIDDARSPAMSPSPTRPTTPECGARVLRSPSPVTATTDLHVGKV